jgi:hypothetical protein
MSQGSIRASAHAAFRAPGKVRRRLSARQNVRIFRCSGVCEGPYVPEKPHARTKPPESPVHVCTYVSGAPVFMAALRARIEVHEGCLVGSSEDRQRYQLLVFPAAEITWDGQTLTYHGVRYGRGDIIEAAGGVMDLAKLRGLRLPDEWASAMAAFVVAPSSQPGILL